MEQLPAIYIASIQTYSSTKLVNKRDSKTRKNIKLLQVQAIVTYSS